jgi:hypothetical protein
VTEIRFSEDWRNYKTNKDSFAARRMPPLVPEAGKKHKLFSNSWPKIFLTEKLLKEANLVSCRHMMSSLKVVITCFTSSYLARLFRPLTFQDII